MFVFKAKIHILRTRVCWSLNLGGYGLLKLKLIACSLVEFWSLMLEFLRSWILLCYVYSSLQLYLYLFGLHVYICAVVHIHVKLKCVVICLKMFVYCPLRNFYMFGIFAFWIFCMIEIFVCLEFLESKLFGQDDKIIATDKIDGSAED